MADSNNQAPTPNLLLAGCWIAGLLLAIFITVLSSGEKGRLKDVSDDVLKWIGQILGPICLLVLSRVFGLNIVKTFQASLSRKKVFWMAFCMSLVYIGFAIGTIFVAAHVNDQGKGIADVKCRQIEILANSGTMILTVIIWPILSMFLEYLFPKSELSSSNLSDPPSFQG
jgi:uncharacterized membrane protein YhaH (DUF805 family)